MDPLIGTNDPFLSNDLWEYLYDSVAPSDLFPDVSLGVTDSPSLAQGLCETETTMSTSPPHSDDSGMCEGSDLLNVASPSSRRNSDDVASENSLSPSRAFSHEADLDLADYFMSGETSDDGTTPSCDESLPAASDDYLTVDSSMVCRKVPVRRSKRVRQAARSAKKSSADSAVPPSPTATARETEVVAVESNTSGASAVSSNGLPNVKIVKVIKSSGSGNSAEDVLKALDDKNRKNALLARSNRAKKKAYIQGLEEQVEKLTEEKTGLEKAIEEKNERIGELEGEVEYLRRVLLNDSALAGLLKNMDRACELRGSSGSRKRGSDGDHDYTSPHKRPRRPATSGGVCLHVDQDSVSLQLCSRCAQKPDEGN